MLMSNCNPYLTIASLKIARMSSNNQEQSNTRACTPKAQYQISLFLGYFKVRHIGIEFRELMRSRNAMFIKRNDVCLL